MWKKLSKSDKYWLIFLVVTWLTGKVFQYFPLLTLEVYTTKLFFATARLLHYLLGWIPFSIGDIGYVLVGFLLLRKLFLLGKKYSLRKLLFWIKSVLLLAPIYVFFMWMWGFNYNKVALHKQLDSKETYTSDELFLLTEKLLHKTNSLQLKIAGNDSTKVHFSKDFGEVKNEIYIAFESFEKDANLQLLPKSPNLKKSLFSGILTYMGFSGYINPFTNEAQINSWIPESKWYVTASHEISHQLGYAKENEANFMAVYVCTQQQENAAMQYAGYSFALKFCLNELYVNNRDQFEYLYNCIHPAVLKEYREQNEFWESYNNPIEPFFKLIYGSYLVANNQPDGLETYSYVTALLVNHGLSL